jgi:hypothetical protein
MELSSVEATEPATIGQDELTFSKAVEPQAPAQNFSLDHSPEALNFPA